MQLAWHANLLFNQLNVALMKYVKNLSIYLILISLFTACTVDEITEDEALYSEAPQEITIDANSTTSDTGDDETDIDDTEKGG